jgi:hypothetical protein
MRPAPRASSNSERPPRAGVVSFGALQERPAAIAARIWRIVAA